MNLIECVVFFLVRSHQIPLMFERSQSWGLVRMTRSRRAKSYLLHLFEKVLFPISASPRRCYGCIFGMCSIDVLTASVSYGGQFFAYLFAPSASCFCGHFRLFQNSEPACLFVRANGMVVHSDGWLFVLFRCTCQGFAWGFFAFCMAF